MKLNINLVVSFFVIIGLITACGEKQGYTEKDVHREEGDHGEHEGEGETVHFSLAQLEVINMKVDTLSKRNISAVVNTNGQLDVSPQNEAIVTAIIGANISSINVIEGDEVKKGQVLGYLAHPNLTRIQNDYLIAYNQLQYLEQEHERQKRLYEGEVGSGKTFQQIQMDYNSAKGAAKSLESQLRQLSLNPLRVREGDFYYQVPVISPIKGSVTNVGVKIGQYVQPEREIFEIINTDHIHADLMVFERDVYKIKEGQLVTIKVEALLGQDLIAKIYSVGKKFDQGTKAVHVHAEIENKTGILIPGMYIKGEIITDSSMTYALPESAVAREGDKYFAFLAEREGENWMFTPVEVIVDDAVDAWVPVRFVQEIPDGTLFAMNNAYYLLAEMKKGDAEHSH